MDRIMKYVPLVVFLLWTFLVLNHMSRGLVWLPLLVMYLPLIPWMLMGGDDE